MGNTNALSCSLVNRASNVQEVSCVMLIDAHQLPITSKWIACYTKEEPLLSKVLQGPISGKDTTVTGCV